MGVGCDVGAEEGSGEGKGDGRNVGRFVGRCFRRSFCFSVRRRFRRCCRRSCRSFFRHRGTARLGVGMVRLCTDALVMRLPCRLYLYMSLFSSVHAYAAAQAPSLQRWRPAWSFCRCERLQCAIDGCGDLSEEGGEAYADYDEFDERNGKRKTERAHVPAHTR